MTLYTIENPVFATYLVAVCIAALKIMGQGWVTVRLMMRYKGGYASPEDLRQTPLNPDPDPAQLDAHPAVERSRRMHHNDLENIPAFIAVGFAFVAIDPPLWAACLFFYGFILARAGHAWAYGTAQTHDMRATFYTIGSLLVIMMALWSLVALLF